MNLFVRIIGVFICGLLSLALAITFGVNYLVRQSLDTEALRTLTIKQQAFDSSINSVRQIISNASINIAQRVDLTQAVTSGDKQALQELSKKLASAQNLPILTILDNSGNVLSRIGSHTKEQITHTAVQKVLKGEPYFSIETGLEADLAFVAIVPIKSEGQITGVLITGFDLSSTNFIDSLKKILDTECTIFAKDTRLSTTIINNGERAVGTVMDNAQVIQAVLKEQQSFVAQNSILGAMYDTIYWPIISNNGESVGMFFIGQPRAVVEKISQELLTAIIITTLVFVVLISGLASLFALSITRPIVQSAKLASDIATGNLNNKLTIKATGEIKTLVESLNIMTDKLREMFNMAEQKTAEATEQARLAEIATTKANEAMKLAEQSKAEGMHAAATELEQVIEAITAASDILQISIAESSKGSSEQALLVGNVASAIEQMNLAVNDVAQSITVTANASAQTKTKAEAGAEIVGSVMRGIGEVHQHSESLKAEMYELDEHAKTISQILEAISDIADQTNLLALNAAIEAARAGDSGRGFAVVADEVRKLAEKTMSLTADVGKAIRGIQLSANKNVQNVNQTVSITAQVAELANNSSNVLHEIVNMVDATATQIANIAGATEEQAATSNEIDGSVTTVKIIAEETSEKMAQANEATVSLAKQAHNLHSLVMSMKSAK